MTLLRNPKKCVTIRLTDKTVRAIACRSYQKYHGGIFYEKEGVGNMSGGRFLRVRISGSGRLRRRGEGPRRRSVRTRKNRRHGARVRSGGRHGFAHRRNRQNDGVEANFLRFIRAVSRRHQFRLLRTRRQPRRERVVCEQRRGRQRGTLARGTVFDF